MTDPIKVRARAVAKGIELVEVGELTCAQVPFRLAEGGPGIAGQVYVWSAPLEGPDLAVTIDQLLLCGAHMPEDNITNFQGVGRVDVLVTIDPARRAVVLVEKYGTTFDEKRKNALALQAKSAVIHQKSAWQNA